MNHKLTTAVLLPAIAGFVLIGCEQAETDTDAVSSTETAAVDDHGHDHGDHDHGDEGHGHHHDHADEVSLGTALVGDMEVEFAQGHGVVAAGKECHLVVKLPYNDNGESVVRVWLGTETPGDSPVAQGIYAPSHDDYDIHVMAPAELPEGTKWQVEVTKPDGTKATGSVEPKM